MFVLSCPVGSHQTQSVKLPFLSHWYNSRSRFYLLKAVLCCFPSDVADTALLLGLRYSSVSEICAESLIETKTSRGEQQGLLLIHGVQSHSVGYAVVSRLTWSPSVSSYCRLSLYPEFCPSSLAYFSVFLHTRTGRWQQTSSTATAERQIWSLKKGIYFQ